MRILLRFCPEQSTVLRARLEYAFRLFCAIYGHEPVLGTGQDNADLTITYAQDGGSQNIVRLSNRYPERDISRPAPEPVPFSQDGEKTVLFYGAIPGVQPDWLAEIFEWVSCADEYSIKGHDSVGRVPFSASYIGRHHLDPRLPYAAIAMRCLQIAIARLRAGCLLRPACPVASANHLVVNTHDVDFLPTRRMESFRRLAKNSLISAMHYKTAGAANVQAKRALAVAFGARDPLNQIGPLADDEHSQGVSASYYFLCRKAHRRDGNYSIDEPATVAIMDTLKNENMEVGVHGSYRSLEEPDGLAAEFDRLRALGPNPIGGRQHWLRFTVPRLVQAVQHAGAAYDASIGWPDDPGYRAGACFAFPPYDFEREAPAPFLEIPLVVMDRAALSSGNHWDGGMGGISEVLASSRRYGWGGVSVLWHPTAFGGGQYPVGVGNAFWDLLDEGLRHHDTWLSAASFVEYVWQRYTDAGLLPARRLQ